MRILIENLYDTEFGVQIEPWAQYEKIAPNTRAEIIFDDHDGPLEFCLNKDGEPCFGINSDITFSVDGRLIFDSRKGEAT
jgi:hypothetical protein